MRLVQALLFESQACGQISNRLLSQDLRAPPRIRPPAKSYRIGRVITTSSIVTEINLATGFWAHPNAT